jgi:membrane-associated protease RseP (regulator of RpoE activity)
MSRCTELSIVLLVAVGCGPTEVIEEQGWAGGEFESIPVHRVLGVAEWFAGHRSGDRLPEDASDDQDRGVLVTNVFDDTPTHAAEIVEGDIILSIDGEAVESAEEFLDRIEIAKPGDKLLLSVYRFGEHLDRTLTVGTERFDRVGTLSIGLHLSTVCDLMPTPDFNVLGLLTFHWGEGRVEHHAPRGRLKRHVAGKDSTESHGISAPEDWSVTLVFVRVSRGRSALSQESFGPAG